MANTAELERLAAQAEKAQKDLNKAHGDPAHGDFPDAQTLRDAERKAANALAAYLAALARS